MVLTDMSDGDVLDASEINDRAGVKIRYHGSGTFTNTSEADIDDVTIAASELDATKDMILVVVDFKTSTGQTLSSSLDIEGTNTVTVPVGTGFNDATYRWMQDRYQLSVETGSEDGMCKCIFRRTGDSDATGAITPEFGVSSVTIGATTGTSWMDNQFKLQLRGLTSGGTAAYRWWVYIFHGK